MLNELDFIVEKPKAIKSQALVDLLNSKQEDQTKEVLLENKKKRIGFFILMEVLPRIKAVIVSSSPIIKEKSLRNLSNYLFPTPITKLNTRL